MNYTNLTRATLYTLLSLSEDYSYSSVWDGRGWRFMFANGYGVSLVKHSSSYGGTQDFWELALLRRESDGWSLYFGSYVTSYDVLGWLSEEDILEHVQNILQL